MLFFLKKEFLWMCVCMYMFVCAFMPWCVCGGWRMCVCTYVFVSVHSSYGVSVEFGGCMCAYVCVCIHAKVCLWRLEDNFGCWFSPSTFAWVPVIWAQVIRLEQQVLSPRSHFPSLPNVLCNGLSWKWRSVFKIGKHHTMSFSLGFLKYKSTLSYLKRAVEEMWKERLYLQHLMLHHLPLW